MAGDIQLGFNFNSGFQKPLREYDVVNTIADRDAIPEGHRYNGRLVKVLDDGTGEGAWFELILGTSSPDLSDNGNWVKVILSQHNDLSDRDAIDSHPISAITDLQDVLNSKAEASDLTDHLNDTNNPHQVSKDDVGLGFVVDSGAVDRFLAEDGNYRQVASGGLPDAPSDGNLYGRKDGAWEDAANYFVGDAPSDGVFYGRLNGAWASGDARYIGDAPADSTPYVRVDNDWEDANNYFIGDAPADSEAYIRVDNTWAKGSDYFIGDATADGKYYSRVDNGWAIPGFKDLSDTPSDYTGNANKPVSVKSDETGLEFVDRVQAQSFGMQAIYSITQAGWVKVAKLISGGGRGKYKLTIGATHTITPHAAEIIIELSNASLDQNIRSVRSYMSYAEFTKVGIADLDGDGLPYLVVYTDNATDRGVHATFQTLNNTGQFTMLTSGDADPAITPDQEVSLPEGNYFNGNGYFMGNVGIGKKGTLYERLELYHDTETQTAIKFANTNSVAGGFLVGIESAGNGVLWLKDDSFIRFGTNSAERVRILSNGNVGIGITNPSEKLEVAGNVKADDFILSSDRRLKKNIEYDKLPSIDGLKPVKFTFKESGEQHYGFIAQDVRETHPELTKGTGEKREDGTIDYLSVKQMDMISMLVQEVQELKSRVTSLENELKELKSK